MNVVLARLVLRYLSGFLLAFAFLPEESAKSLSVDQDLITVVGVLFGFAAEGFYYLAKKYGWRT